LFEKVLGRFQKNILTVLQKYQHAFRERDREKDHGINTWMVMRDNSCYSCKESWIWWAAVAYSHHSWERCDDHVAFLQSCPAAVWGNDYICIA